MEDMIEELNAGITVETLLQLIEWKLTHTPIRQLMIQLRSSRWVM
jgi:hypothetical protein